MALLAVAASVLALAGCPHDASLGTVHFARGGEIHVVSLSDCRDRIVGRAPAPRAPASVPGVLVHGHALWLRRPGGGVIRLTRALPNEYGLPQTPVPLSRSPDGRWLAWSVGIASGSVTSDGRPLEVTRLAPGGSTHLLAAANLGYPDYRTWCGSTLVFVGGAFRTATHQKRLFVAGPPDWQPRALWSAPARASGSVTCAPDSESVAVLSQPDEDTGNFFAAHWQLWRVWLDGRRRLLDRAPPGYADESPRWSRDGRSLLFVRERKGRGSLMLWREGRVTGPIVSLGYELGFYGHRDWWSRAGWSRGS